MIIVLMHYLFCSQDKDKYYLHVSGISGFLVWCIQVGWCMHTAETICCRGRFQGFLSSSHHLVSPSHLTVLVCSLHKCCA